MGNINKIFNFDIESEDGLLYYDYDAYMKKVSYEQGEIDGALKVNKKIIKNMLDNNFDKNLMLKITNLKKEELNKIIEDINQEETKSNKTTKK